MGLNPLSFIKDAIGAVGGILDNLHTSGEEKLAAKEALITIEAELARSMMDYERALVSEQGQTVRAEITGHSSLQRLWRPIMMLWFAGLVGAYWFGFTPENLEPRSIDALFEIVKFGLTGYVVGRSAEKITTVVMGAKEKR